MKILKVLGKEIYDSQGWPTLEAEIWLDDGTILTGYAPSGISKGRYEAVELRDGDRRFWGKGVQKAIEVIDTVISPALVGKEPVAPELDSLLMDLDGTENKSKLGGNVLVSTSMALYRAHAHMESVELYELIAFLSGQDTVMMPCPMINVINGGRHAYNNLSIQEFMIAPIGASSFRQGMETCITLFHELTSLLRKKGKFVAFGAEGGLSANFANDREALDTLLELLERTDFEESGLCALALDVAASELFDSTTNQYTIDGVSLSSEGLVGYYEELINSYPIYSIEDGLGLDDWDGWKLLNDRLSDRIQIVGDDIFATNSERLRFALEDNLNTAVIVKPNQIGTVTETLQFIDLAKKNQLGVVISHRSHETEDPFIADLAVGTSAGQIKAGGCTRSERLAKYNRLLAIEDELMSHAQEIDEF